MGEWATYSLDDFVMFSPRAWYGLLAMHNQAWWPLQLAAPGIAAGVAWALHRRLRAALRLVLGVCGAGLLWVAVAFHAGPHAGINLAAPAFGWAFAAQGVALIALALLRPGLVLAHGGGLRWLALALLASALLLYPVLAPWAGRPLPQTEWFALAPDPTMLAALAAGLLVLGGSTGLRHPWRTGVLLLVLPLVWCGVAGATAWVLGAPDWWCMPAAGLMACAGVVWHARGR